MTTTSHGPSHLDERIAVVNASSGFFRAGIMSHSGHANFSARVNSEEIVLTSTGQVRELTVEDFAVVRLDGGLVEGDLAPTNAEIITMHTKVYLARPEVGAVVHTHSPNLLAFAMANLPVPARYEALLRFGQAEEVPVAAWAPRGSERSVEAIVELVRERPGTNAVLLGNHGVLVFGASVEATAALLTVLEEAAEAELGAMALGGAKSLPDGALEAVRVSMARVAP
ncbi:MAG TPA: class II aldolase/adducin family protein [Acidimicrobiales bacterium]|nr:class II aldolase/adducin family protein [Acidimicrobiales bacterium]